MPDESFPPLSFEDVPHLKGQSFAGEPFTISAVDRSEFERLTGIDRVYLTPDPPEFPGGMVEGFHVLALLDAMVNLARPLDPSSAYGYNYGLDRVRWTHPAVVDQLLQPWFECVDVSPRGAGWLIRYRCTIRVDGVDKPIMVAEWLVLILPRQEEIGGIN